MYQNILSYKSTPKILINEVIMGQANIQIKKKVKLY